MEGCESKGWYRYNSKEVGCRGDKGGEKIGTVDVVSDVGFESIDTIWTHDKPDLEPAEPA